MTSYRQPFGRTRSVGNEISRDSEAPRQRPALLRLVAVTIAARTLGLVVLAIESRHYHESFSSLATRFDGTFYRIIANSGYPSHLPVGPQGGVLKNPTAFFPGYPLAVRAIMDATGTSFYVAALVLNVLASIVAAFIIFEICLLLKKGPRFALLAAALWAIWPISFISSMTYGDTLFVALAAATLWALLREQWLLAGVLAAVASATRPNGIILALCCLYAAVIAIRKHRVYRSLVAPLIAPAGLVIYFLYLWAHTHKLDAWFVTERQGWRVYFDGGLDNLHHAWKYIHTHNVVGVGLIAFVVIMLVLLGLFLKSREHPILVLWTLGVIVMALTSRNDFTSVPRFFYPAFPILFPLVYFANRLKTAALSILYGASGIAMTAMLVYFTAHSHYPP